MAAGVTYNNQFFTFLSNQMATSNTIKLTRNVVFEAISMSNPILKVLDSEFVFEGKKDDYDNFVNIVDKFFPKKRNVYFIDKGLSPSENIISVSENIMNFKMISLRNVMEEFIYGPVSKRAVIGIAVPTGKKLLLHDPNKVYKDGDVEMSLLGIPFVYMEGKKNFFSEVTGRRVDIEGTFVAQYTTTQRAYKKITGKNPSHHKDSLEQPVESISFIQFLDYLNAINKKSGFPEIGVTESDNLFEFKDFEKSPGDGLFHLPTAEQWEYAAKGGQLSRGFTFPGGEDPLELGWIAENSGDRTHPVGEKLPNELNIFDLFGNTWEGTRSIFFGI